MSATCRLDRIHVANQISDSHIGRGKFFYVAIIGRQVRDGSLVALARNQLVAALADGLVRVIADLATGNVRQLGIEQCGQGAKDTALGLSAQAEQNKVVPGKNGVHQLGDDCVFIANDAGKNSFAAAQTCNQIFAEFIFYLARAQPLLRERTFPELAQSRGKIHEGPLENNYTLRVPDQYSEGEPRSAKAFNASAHARCRWPAGARAGCFPLWESWRGSTP